MNQEVKRLKALNQEESRESRNKNRKMRMIGIQRFGDLSISIVLLGIMMFLMMLAKGEKPVTWLEGLAVGMVLSLVVKLSRLKDQLNR